MPETKEAKYKLYSACGSDTEDMRPMAKLLYSLGADLCKQAIYKDLLRTQDKKRAAGKLDAGEQRQSEDLRAVHTKLAEHNTPYLLEPNTCSRCAHLSIAPTPRP